MEELNGFKEKFDLVLKDYLAKKIKEFSKDLSDPFLLDIIEYPQKIVLSGGKRIRPYVASLMYRALSSKDSEKALELFVALEIFHNFLLVHDDIIDEDSVRHGVKTVHEYIKDKLRVEGREGDLNHIANSQAILLGDILLSWAFAVFEEVDIDRDKLKTAKSFFNKMADDVLLGQIIDIDSISRKDVSGELIEKKDRLKTASYTFIRPLQIGASLAEIDENTEKFCEDLGLNLGLAFQMQDDLLDLENTQTKEVSLERIKNYLDSAIETIEKSELEKSSKKEFNSFIEALRNRKY